ncbi:uncharacterized protein F5891DRAFT_1193992 [Suillus fuscotomentosus]|uniref:Uncharacterized protein n=1 Tax=Suillus fuscotomentosus TaxID=1912939 RepID=A0AAD4DX03_9AGAM|nr:uncharacterized protein F5891DRAFT_1193992 [Suillus fuscotomentosus]KAG1895659.1 hypothetical protein F5891DRAFT_1193992 [Suillus fuscotomentosus]
MRLLFTTALSLSQAFVVLSQHAEAAFRAPLTCEERARQAGYPPNPGYAPYPPNPAYPLNPPNFPAPLPGLCPQTCGNGHGVAEPSCRCTNYPVCGHGKYLGIKYGHCYILSFSDGEQLGIDRDHTDYKKNGFFVDIPFKVCNSTSDCSRGKEVEMGQSFSLQDQHGLYRDTQSTKGWINDASGGAHMEFTTDASHAGKFTGIPTCTGGECAIQMYGGPSGGALAYACPMPQPGLTFYGNPKVGQKLRFSEVSCDEYEVPLTSGINLQ